MEKDKPGNWKDLWVRTMELGMGAFALTKETAKKMVDELEERGQLSRQEASDTLERLRSAGQDQRRHLEEMIQKYVDAALEKGNVARKGDIEMLKGRIDALEAKQGSAGGSAHHEGREGGH